MTKTYLIEKEYGRDVRLTVEDDVRARVGYSERPDVMAITFERPSGQYETETVAAFSNVNNLRLQDPTIELEEKQVNYAEAIKERQEMVADPIETWVRV